MSSFLESETEKQLLQGDLLGKEGMEETTRWTAGKGGRYREHF